MAKNAGSFQPRESKVKSDRSKTRGARGRGRGGRFGGGDRVVDPLLKVASKMSTQLAETMQENAKKRKALETVRRNFSFAFLLLDRDRGYPVRRC